VPKFATWHILRPVKTVTLALAVCVLFFPPTGCKSSSQHATDAATNDAPVASDAAQPDAASDVVAMSADLATSPTDTPAAATDLRTPELDLSVEVARVDAPSPDGPMDEASSEAGCSGWSTLNRLSPAEVSDLLATSDPIVINVHIPYAGDIPGTDTSIPYNNVDAIEAYLNYDHCADVVLICMSGGMSQSAGNELVKRGYLRVRDLNGGMDAWQKAGYTLLKDGGT